MVYCEERKLLFVHIPKTGGTTIEREMDCVCSSKGYGVKAGKAMQHYTCNEYHKNVPFTDDYWKFSIVRNPYSRFISDFFYNKERLRVNFFDVIIFFKDFNSM